MTKKFWQNHTFFHKIIAVVFLISTVFFFVPLHFSKADDTQNQEIDSINQEIDKKKKEIEEIEQKIRTYEQSISAKEKESLTLENEVSILEDQITKTNLDIEKAQKQLRSINLEITKLEGKIGEKEKEIKNQKGKIEDLIRSLYKKDRKTYLEITLTKNSLSEFFNQVKYLKKIQSEVQDTLDNIKILKESLESQKGEEVKKKTEAEELKEKLEGEKESLDGQKTHKNDLLDETKLNEEQFQQLVNDLKNEEAKADSDISSLESQAREKLQQKQQQGNPNTNEGKNEPFELGPARLSWPVSSRKITAYFHDPAYPFRYIFEHPAIDISVPQGSPVHAAADGIIAIANKKDWVRDDNGKILYSAYNYVTIVHNDGLTSVYGHLSEVLVSVDEYVRKGDIIGKSGATPGTAGAGRLTTGPHLHFAVHLNGIPVDPLEYLP